MSYELSLPFHSLDTAERTMDFLDTVKKTFGEGTLRPTLGIDWPDFRLSYEYEGLHVWTALTEAGELWLMLNDPRSRDLPPDKGPWIVF